MGIPQPRVACKWPLNFRTPIELGEAIVPEWTEGWPTPNGFLLRLQGLWVVEKSLSVSYIQGISTEQKTWKETQIANNEMKTGETFNYWEQIEELETFLGYWAVLLNCKKNHSFQKSLWNIYFLLFYLTISGYILYLT